MTLYSYLRNRDIGLNCNFGDSDYLYKTIYSSFRQNKFFGPGEYGGIFNLEFSPDGSLLVAACEKKSILLIDPNNSYKSRTVQVITDAHHDCVNCVKFIDDRLFATCSDDSTVAIWDTRNLSTKLKSLHGHSNWVKNIEYSKKDKLLVTSGFDGSIFTWDINLSTENGFVYRKVFHTTGLMRCRVSPDANRLVICTTGGYLIIIHDLNLSTLDEDLKGFRPNVYRLMQLGRQYYPVAGSYEKLFTKSQKNNRVEFISDFPEGNKAEVVSSLQIHPQGWCALSRNISYDESSEWSCVHDIQELDKSDDEDFENPELDLSSDVDPSIENVMLNNDNNEAPPSQRELDVPAIESSSAAGSLIPTNSQTSRLNTTDAPPSRLNTTDAPPSRIPSDGNAWRRSYPDLWVAVVTFQTRSRRQNSPQTASGFDMYGINSGVLQPEQPVTTNSSPKSSIKENHPRMLYYIEEPNKGKGLIKELCFSADGRIICSPYGFGIRLLAFNDHCAELPYTLCPDNKPKELKTIRINKPHRDIVLSTKFSPRQPLLVSGCLRGKIVCHYPKL